MHGGRARHSFHAPPACASHAPPVARPWTGGVKSSRRQQQKPYIKSSATRPWNSTRLLEFTPATAGEQRSGKARVGVPYIYFVAQHIQLLPSTFASNGRCNSESAISSTLTSCVVQCPTYSCIEDVVLRGSSRIPHHSQTGM